MNRYWIRAAKYALQLIVLFFIIFFLMNSLSTQRLTIEQFFSNRGLLMCGAIIVFALLYPFFGYTKRTLTFNASTRVEGVENVMAMCGFKRVGGDDHRIEFRAATKSKHWLLMAEDLVIVDTDSDGVSTISGVRKEVVKATLRMGTFIS